MKLAIFTAAFAFGACATPNGHTRSTSWAGTNADFLHALTEANQLEYVDLLARQGIKVMRLFISDQPGDNACIKGTFSWTGCPHFETTIGEYNLEVLDLVDRTLTYLAKNHIKAIISTHDANLLNGTKGNDIYGQTYGSENFYTDQEAMNAYDSRLSAILNYKGAYSGRLWKEWYETILAFDIQNEPFAADPSQCQQPSAEEWLCGRASHMRNDIGTMMPVLVASGGVGGDLSHGCTFVGAECEDLDIVSIHYNVGSENNNIDQWSSSYSDWMEQANGKRVILEEWALDKTEINPKKEFHMNTQVMNRVGMPWLYRQLLPFRKCYAEYEKENDDRFGFTMDSGVKYVEELRLANVAPCPQDWFGIV